MMVFPLEEETVREMTGVGRRVSLRMTSTAVPLADPFIPVAMLIKKKNRGANGERRKRGGAVVPTHAQASRKRKVWMIALPRDCSAAMAFVLSYE